MSRKLKVPEFVTGKWIAKVIHGSRLTWTTGELHVNDAYCALGIIAKEAGVPDRVLSEVPQGPRGLAGIYGTNDRSGSKEQVVQKFCNMDPKRKFRIGPWIKMLKERSK